MSDLLDKSLDQIIAAREGGGGGGGGRGRRNGGGGGGRGGRKPGASASGSSGKPAAASEDAGRVITVVKRTPQAGSSGPVRRTGGEHRNRQEAAPHARPAVSEELV